MSAGARAALPSLASPTAKGTFEADMHCGVTWANRRLPFPPRPRRPRTRPRGTANLREQVDMQKPTVLPASSPRDPRPVDIETMRAAVAQLLAEDAPLPSHDDLQTVILQLRGHLMLLVPEVEDLAGRLPDDDVLGKLAKVGIGKARRRLDDLPGLTLPLAVRHAQHLARSVEELCTHPEHTEVRP